MTDHLFVKPAPGLKVRRPERAGEHLAPEGDAVPSNSYWHRQLRDGSVVAADAPAAPVPRSRARTPDAEPDAAGDLKTKPAKTKE